MKIFCCLNSPVVKPNLAVLVINFEACRFFDLPKTMKLLKIGKYLINSQCIVQAWTNSDASEIKVCISCKNSLVGVVSPCVVENEGKLEKLDSACLNFLGEEAEALPPSPPHPPPPTPPS